MYLHSGHLSGAFPVLKSDPYSEAKVIMLLFELCFFLQENVHFYVADMIISALETMKWNLMNQQLPEIWGTEEASGSHGDNQIEAEVAFYTPARPEPGSSTSSDSGYEGKLGKRLNLRVVISAHAVCPLSSPEGGTYFSPLKM